MSDDVAEALAVVVSGIPGSGKTTLASALAGRLGWPLISKDVVKEALFDALGTGDLAWSRRLGRAGHAVMYAMVRDMPRAVLEAHFEHGVAESELLALDRRLVQVYCRCPIDLAVQRYESRIADRDRNPGHLPEHQDGAATFAWRTGTPMPLDLQGMRLIEVDTTGPVDMSALTTAVLAAVAH